MKSSNGVLSWYCHNPINAKDRDLLAVMDSKQSTGSAINGTVSKCPIMTSMEETIRRLDGNTIDSEVVDTKSVTDSSSSKCTLGKSTVGGSGTVGNTGLTTSDGIDSRKMESKAQTQSKTNCVQNTCTGCPCDAKTNTQDTGCHSQHADASGTQSEVQIRKVSNISNVSFGGSEEAEEGERKLDLRGLIDSVGTLLIPVVSTIMRNPLLYRCWRHIPIRCHSVLD